MKNNRLWRGAVFVLTLLPVAELLTAIALLPDTVAVHWGLDGTPDRYSSRFELLIPVAIILLVGAVFWFKGKGEQPKGFRAGGMGAMLLFNVIVPILLYVTFHPQVNLLRFFLWKNRLWTGRGGGTGGGELPAEGLLGVPDEAIWISHLLHPFGRAGLGAQPAVCGLLLHRRGTGGDSVGAAAERLCLCADFSGSHAGSKPGGVSVLLSNLEKTG